MKKKLEKLFVMFMLVTVILSGTFSPIMALAEIIEEDKVVKHLVVNSQETPVEILSHKSVIELLNDPTINVKKLQVKRPITVQIETEQDPSILLIPILYKNDLYQLIRWNAETKAFGVKTTRPIIRSGNPKKQLAKLIPEEFEIDVIMMGATSQDVISRMLVGSTAGYVVAHAPCTVVVVK